ncbi:Lrp/AsnC family transcriptional regulator [Candidatus Halocynthiibacter alkanivorans]|jgi:DNA-binding Lrp family transcriptional regulator|uniref:Lrp/AsnC family transcriptional regulator n=1 Tax=Candidatus Halocynthiibacter alkanivorans TaxID=2267619 RepID=UPI00190F2926|nr:Lrp/AsnC family transcriptional regulator [Candidatus Halocynthiibacter alkanivorans]
MTEITETDHRLLAALKRNARASVTELAQATGVARATVKSRLDRLVESGTIRRFTIETDLEDREMVRAITTIELQGSMSRSVVRSLRAIPHVHALHSTNGAWDLVAEIRASDLRSFDQVLRKIRDIPGVLNSETSLLLNSA